MAQIFKKPLKRPVMLDGANIAWAYGKNEHFDTNGLLLALEYFLRKGYKPYIVIYHCRTAQGEFIRKDMTPKSQILMGLLTSDSPDNFFHQMGLIYSVCSDTNDDEVLLNLAGEHYGSIISRDKFRNESENVGIFTQHHQFLIKERVVDYSFSSNEFRLSAYVGHEKLHCYNTAPKPEYDKIANEEQLTEDEFKCAISFIETLKENASKYYMRVLPNNENGLLKFVCHEHGYYNEHSKVDFQMKGDLTQEQREKVVKLYRRRWR